MNDLRVVFMGTPEFAVPVLEELHKCSKIILVVTQPDKEVGRKKEIKESAIKKKAKELNIEVFQPNKIRNDYQHIIDLKPDIIITCAYGQIIPEAILNAPQYGCINVHASLLPKLRGGAPIHHAIIDGYDKTGITIMYMDKTMDTGDIIIQKEIPIEEDDNVETLHNKLSKLGAYLMASTLPNIIVGSVTRIKQNNDEATYGYNITREDEHINFNKTAKEVYNQIRGLNPYPGAFLILNGQEMKVIAAFIGDENSTLSPGNICDITQDAIGISTQDKIIYLTRVKPFGKKEMDARDYINGIDKSKLIHTIVE